MCWCKMHDTASARVDASTIIVMRTINLQVILVCGVDINQQKCFTASFLCELCDKECPIMDIIMVP